MLRRRLCSPHAPPTSAPQLAAAVVGYRELVERVAVRVVGAFGVDGLDEHAIGSRKARTLLKLLACERGGPVSADRIADAIWPQGLPSRPADQISVLVSRLRSVLGGRIVRSDAGYSLQYDWLDLDELLERSREAVSRLAAGHFGAARSASAAALRLITGRALGDEDAPWADAVRATIDRAAIDARHAGAEAALEVGAWTETVALGIDALDNDPFDEAALRLVMTAHARLGRVGSALELYAAFRTRLVEEFGIGPSAETERVHDDIVLGADRPQFGASPDAAVIGIVGRDSELAALNAFLAQPGSASQFVVIQGEPGIGKSALVEEWGRLIAASGVDVIIGRCGQTGLSLPLQTVLDAIGDWLKRVLGPGEAEALVRADPLLSTVLGVMGELRLTAGDDTTTPEQEPAIGRRRLFAALVELVQGVRADVPMVVVMDDLDQSDAATVFWLWTFVRSAPAVLVVATCRKPAPTFDAGIAMTLGPLGLEAAAQLIGPATAARIYDRSAGNPLFLLELAHVAGSALPTSIVEAVGTRSAALGSAASTVRIAALLGSEIDLDLLTACCRRPVAEVLDHIEAAITQGLVVDEASGLRFQHDVVREALVAATTGSVRSFVHHQAALHLSGRSDRKPLDAAHHAERGGRNAIAAASFIEGAQIAMRRFEADLAKDLIDRAIALDDSPDARIARARIHLARRDFDAAGADIGEALEVARSPAALELAGWIAYYRRDYTGAQAYVSEALQSASSAPVRTSAATLDGRIRHSRGDLTGAVERLQPVVAEVDERATAGSLGVARVWLASALTHQGHVGRALRILDDADEAGDISTVGSHPFATAHGLFARCLAAGTGGMLPMAFRAADALYEHAHTTGAAGLRFGPIACNMRSWLERSVGNVELAAELSTNAVSTAESSFDEPAAHARLDEVELLVIRGRLDAAAIALDNVKHGLRPSSTMAWHQYQRVLLLSGRVSLGCGDPATAAEFARQLLEDCHARSSQRYGVLGAHLLLIAGAADGHSPEPAEVRAILAAIDKLAGLDAWRLIAELASATGIARLWPEAEARALTLSVMASEVPHLDPRAVRAWTTSMIEGIRRRSS